MSRDHDTRYGDDGTREAIEHVYFADPRLIIGKRIGFGVYNYGDRTSQPQNQFKIFMANGHKMQVYPKQSKDIFPFGEFAWMQLKQRPASGSYTEQDKLSARETFVYTEEMDLFGMGENSNAFPEHVTALAENDTKFKGWVFSKGMGASAEGSTPFRNYISDCKARWNEVKVKVSSHHGAQVLDNLNFL